MMGRGWEDMGGRSREVEEVEREGQAAAKKSAERELSERERELSER